MRILSFSVHYAIFVLLGISSLFAQQKPTVRIWEEPLTIPTYLVEPAETSPMFFHNQSYQGASRVIYPYALQDNLSNVKENKVYKALYLENEYIKLCVLPEIGGRLFYATDKTNGYEIFYRQHVIKPANIGMLGAWISGGIEFCVFHHHRASTNLPVDYKLVQNDDGSATIWIGETEPRHRMKWSLGISLFPGKSLIEVDGRLINPTETTNSILYWANVATHVNNDYQVIFPPSTDFAVYHAKNSFSHWPVTTETYEGNDYYKNSIDASWWKNHPNPISFFAHNIKDGFLAGYDYGKRAGTMHVGNRHIVAGAKLWEWGPGAYGTMWDSQVLTDSDGPYAELMAGAYSDNQPDYSWLKPHEVKTFKQYWYPIRDTEGASFANLNGMLNLKQLDPKQLLVAANTTSAISKARIVLMENEKILFEKTIDIAPGKPFSEKIAVKPEVDIYNLRLSLLSPDGKELIFYQPQQKKDGLPLPEIVIPPADPKDIATVEELYLTGLRIRQFHNARSNPNDYFLEGLKRDPLDTRCNNEMGLYHKQRGEYDIAAGYFRKTLYRLTKDYTRPLNIEPMYHLGLVLKSQGKLADAYDTLYRAAWDQAFASAAYFNLAQISCRNHDFSMALEEVNKSLAYNNTNLSARNLKAAILRNMDLKEAAFAELTQILDVDPLNIMGANEKYLLSGDEAELEALKAQLRDAPESYLELAVSYINSGLMSEASRLLNWAATSDKQSLANYPTIHYYLGYLAHLADNETDARQHFEKAGSLPIDYCFPFRLETENVYQTALTYNAQDAKVWYYLGNLLYDKQPERAIACWQQSVKSDTHLAMAYRNLGWGYNQTDNDVPKAISAYESAIASTLDNPMFFFELDKLYERAGTPLEKRYELMVKNHDHLKGRKDALLQEIKVLILAGEYDKAGDYLLNNFFPRQEGVDDLHDIYVDAMLLNGLKSMDKKDYNGALDNFKKADSYPENHQIGRDDAYQRNAQIWYNQGMALEAAGKKKEAKLEYEKVIALKTTEPQYRYYVALAMEKTGMKKEAQQLYGEIQEAGQKLLASDTGVDFFSKFGEGQSSEAIKANGNYLLGLASLGKGKEAEAKQYFTEAIALNPNHVWAQEFGREGI